MNISDRRKSIEQLVQSNDKFTVKDLVAIFKVSKGTIATDIHSLSNVHWQDCFLYYGERL